MSQTPPQPSPQQLYAAIVHRLPAAARPPLHALFAAFQRREIEAAGFLAAARNLPGVADLISSRQQLAQNILNIQSLNITQNIQQAQNTQNTHNIQNIQNTQNTQLTQNIQNIQSAQNTQISQNIQAQISHLQNAQILQQLQQQAQQASQSQQQSPQLSQAQVQQLLFPNPLLQQQQQSMQSLGPPSMQQSPLLQFQQLQQLQQQQQLHQQMQMQQLQHHQLLLQTANSLKRPAPGSDPVMPPAKRPMMMMPMAMPQSIMPPPLIPPPLVAPADNDDDVQIIADDSQNQASTTAGSLAQDSAAANQASQGTASSQQSLVRGGAGRAKKAALVIPDDEDSERLAKEEEKKRDVLNMDVDTMMDVTNYGGVNVREEEDNAVALPSAKNFPPANPSGVDRSRVQNLVDANVLKDRIDRIAKEHSIESVSPDVSSYIAMAAESYLRTILERSLKASQHRTGILLNRLLTSTECPDVALRIAVVDNVKTVLAEVEAADRAAEDKARRVIYPFGGGVSASEANAARIAESGGGGGGDDAAEAGGTGGGGGAGAGGEGTSTTATKKAKKKALVSEEVKAKATNKTALLLAGGAKSIKSWMLADGGASVSATKKSKDTASGVASSSAANNPDDLLATTSDSAAVVVESLDSVGTGTGLDGSVVVRFGREMAVPEMTRVTLRDALFVLEREKAFAKSDVVYRWLGKIK